MERLNERLLNLKKGVESMAEPEIKVSKLFLESVCEYMQKLKEYKDLEEQGLLLKLPCKVGDTVYALTPFCEICEQALDNEYACETCNKGEFATETKFDYEMIPMFGKTVFLTKAEAEQALQRMKEGGM